jgi:hypothetical protein
MQSIRQGTNRSMTSGARSGGERDAVNRLVSGRFVAPQCKRGVLPWKGAPQSRSKGSRRNSVSLSRAVPLAQTANLARRGDFAARS